MDKVKEHYELVGQLHDTYMKKNKDYGDSFGKQFEEYGEISAAIRLEDKLQRYKNLIKQDAQVDESKEDTLLDMANYAIMTVIELRKAR